ncbi:MAG: hypothetical protein AAFN70_21055, partial [Planctomycetota bacterium]
MVFATLACGLYALLLTIPAPSTLRVPVVIQSAASTDIRCRTEGFLATELPQLGQRLRQGDVIARFENRELKAELRQAEIAVQQQQIVLDDLLNQSDTSGYLAERERMDHFEQQRKDLQQRVNDLTIVALQDGEVVRRHQRAHPGVFAQRGTRIVSIGSLEPPLAVAMVPADVANDIQWQQQAVSVRVWGDYDGKFQGVLKRFDAAASDQVPHFAFAASAGGAIAVTNVAVSQQEQSQTDGLSRQALSMETLDRQDESQRLTQALRFVTPQVRAEIALSISKSSAAPDQDAIDADSDANVRNAGRQFPRPGQTGTATFHAHRQPLL